jgi:predicted peroxiredoxin/TusA-related sulfurtransferase
MTQMVAARSIDLRGKKITTYILHEAVAALSEMSLGEVLELVTDRFEPIEGDVSAWCRMTGHKLVAVERDGEAQRFAIEKSEVQPSGRQLTLVISNPGLEELLSPLGFALAAALAGTQVYIYFQGPAVRILTAGFKGSLQGLGRPFSGFARKGMAEIGHSPPQEKLRQLQTLGARFYACGPSMEHFGVKKDSFAFEDVVVSEYVAFMELMQKADIHIFLQ